MAATKKTVLLTGASRGLGKAVHLALAQAGGYDVLTPSRREMDLQNPESIRSYVAAAGGIDILINDAGINILKPVDGIDSESLRQMLSINLEAPLQLIGLVAPHMKAQRFGRIVNVSSIWGVRSKELRSLYSMTKSGLNGITRALARELGPYNVLVNSICPGYINTELTQKNVPPDEQERIRQTIPLGRFAEPAEIAAFVKFLVSDENTYITGQALVIDGGFLA